MATLQKWISLYPKEKTMKKSIFVVALLALTACGSKTYYVTSTDAPTTTVKVTKTTDAPIATPAPTQPPVAWSDEEEFISDIYNGYDETIYLEDQDMIDAGYTTCDALRNGMSGYEVLEVIISSGGGISSIEELLGTVVASAVVNFCPEQTYKFGE
jgi:hypothetical protein